MFFAHYSHVYANITSKVAATMVEGLKAGDFCITFGVEGYLVGLGTAGFAPCFSVSRAMCQVRRPMGRQPGSRILCYFCKFCCCCCCCCCCCLVLALALSNMKRRGGTTSTGDTGRPQETQKKRNNGAYMRRKKAVVGLTLYHVPIPRNAIHAQSYD